MQGPFPARRTDGPLHVGLDGNTLNRQFVAR
jgi:hypothetical protein